MSRKSKAAQFRITDEEDGHLRQAAEDAGMKLSDYLRAVALHPTVVVVAEERVVLIPSTVTLAEADERLRERFEAIRIAALQDGQGESPAPAPGSADSLAAQPPAGATLPSAEPAPGSPPATPSSPGDAAEGMVGSSSQAASAAGASSEAPAALAGETCLFCGGRDGRHQGFCEVVTGESPVSEEAAPPGQETMADYVERRVGEGELRVVAEAEWRQRGQIPAGSLVEGGGLPHEVDRRVACPSCGAMKLPEAQCADCGRRPG